MKCQMMEFCQTGCIPPPQQQHFQSPQFILRLICSLQLSALRLQLLGSQTSNGRQMLIGNGLYSTLPIQSDQ
jgi:hypothetical protein